jgi:acyl dehydratase
MPILDSAIKLVTLQAPFYHLPMVDASGPSFEELTLGQVFRGPGRTLTETDLVTFCMITGDWSGIHADEVYAGSTGAGQRIFHSTFGIALALAMSADVLPLRNPVIAALGIRDWAFKSPLLIGDTIHLQLTVARQILSANQIGAGAGGWPLLFIYRHALYPNLLIISLPDIVWNAGLSIARLATR